MQPARISGRPMTEEQFKKKFADKLSGKDFFKDNFPMTVAEYRSAYWEIQAHLLDFAAGAEKTFLFSGFNFYNHYDFVHLKGVCYAAMAKVITSKKEIKPFKTGNNASNGVMITDKSGIKTIVLWSVNDKEVAVSLVTGEEKEYKAMDALGNPLSFKTKQGILYPKLIQAPLYIFNVPEDITGLQIMEVKGDSIIDPSEVYKGEVIVNNPFKKKLEAKLKTQLPDGWQINIDKEISIENGKSVNVPFTLTAKQDAKGICNIRMDILVSDNAISSVEKGFLVRKIKKISKMKKGIVLDGNLSDWEGIGEEKAETINNVVIGMPNPMFPDTFPHWKNAEDLSFKVKTLWDNDAFYVMLDVIDDNLVVVPDKDRGKSSYLYDCVEIFLDIRNKSEVSSNEQSSLKTMHFMVIPNITDKVASCKVVLPESLLINRNSTKFVGRLTEKGYLIEGRIVMDSMFRNGNMIGFDIAIDDSEKGGERKTQMVLYGTVDNYKDTSVWGRFILTE